ncbi:Pantothenate kinase 4 [Chamberlinius hualienensis]
MDNLLRKMQSNVSCDELVEGRSGTQSIQLPAGDELVFRNLSKAKRFAIDIGGSLTKIAYYSTVPFRKVLYSLSSEDGSKSDDEASYEVSLKERLHFIRFETKYIESCLNFIQMHLVSSSETDHVKTINATGGGAYKYTELISSTLGLKVNKQDELQCLIKGCNFLLKNIPNEVFIYQKNGNPEYKFQNVEPNVFPYLLVNIGSGVSILKVESESKYERIGGSSLGGGTFWGLGSLLTKAKNFDELLQLANQGDHRNVDMLVKDIYGGDYKMLGLPGDLIASSFGKATYYSKDTDFNSGQFSDEDIARSLLFTVSNDIGQISCLYAMMHQLDRIYFGGYFLRGHPLSMYTLSYAVQFWSQGKVQALFLRHEGYLGAIGAFLNGAEDGAENYSWNENYAGSSGLESPIPAQMLSSSNHATVEQLEMDRFDVQLGFCPLLLDSHHYVADTVDLTLDAEAREYWLLCFEEGIDKFVEVAINNQPNRETAVERANLFKKKYLARLRHLNRHPFAFGSLTVRNLLDMREHCLLEFDFPDPYLSQKHLENEKALKLLPNWLKSLSSLDWISKQEALVCGVLAGNVFDWGAKEVVKLMENGEFGFEEAKKELQVRPWLVDDLDQWLDRLKGPAHNCAAIFVDNSGIDIVLGIVPFAIELLQRGTKVILCANAKPALNDVTYIELLVLVKEISAFNSIVAQSLDNEKLLVMDSGQASPCLDLSRLNQSLADALLSEGVDLVVLEGMGRAVHTNLDAKFKTESLKMAVLKNKWLANRLGGDMFSVMFKYERGELN